MQEVVAKAPQMPPTCGTLSATCSRTRRRTRRRRAQISAHTVDCQAAQELQKRVAAVDNPLAIMVQVNTSAEASKSGVAPADCAALAAEVARSCPLLRVCGLMCIGKYSADEGSALSDFEALVQCRTCGGGARRRPGVTRADMGMSHDFEQAVAAGATAVRVG